MSFRDLATALARSEAARLSVEPRHYVRWDEPSRTSPRSQKTVCGKYVSPRATALAAEVTCPDCRAVITAEAAGSDDPEDVFGAPPASYPKPEPRFDVLRDYIPRRVR